MNSSGLSFIAVDCMYVVIEEPSLEDHLSVLGMNEVAKPSQIVRYSIFCNMLQSSFV